MKGIHRAWKARMIPTVAGARGTILKNSKNWNGKLCILDIVAGAQFSAILGTAHSLRNALCFKAG